jgi:hypothetical protein
VLGKPKIVSQPDTDFYEVAQQKLENMLPVDPERLNNLAIARANAISKYFTEKCGLDMGRIYILAPELAAKDSKDFASVLSLNTDN